MTAQRRASMGAVISVRDLSLSNGSRDVGEGWRGGGMRFDYGAGVGAWRSALSCSFGKWTWGSRAGSGRQVERM